MKKNNQSEPSRQFQEIFENHYSPQEIEKRKIKERREKRKEEVRKDAGI